MADSTLLGMIGRVTTAVRGGERPGEIRVVVRGLAHHYIAYCAQALDTDTDVLVTGLRGDLRVDVEPWSSLSLRILETPKPERS